jgi:hypothetical protein
MATRDEIFPSDYLKAVDVDPPITVTVKECVIETLGRGAQAERKGVLYFTDHPKKLTVNVTNWDAMVAITGEKNSDRWAGTVIEAFAVDCESPKGPTRGVRIRRPLKKSLPKSSRSAKPTKARTPHPPANRNQRPDEHPLPPANLDRRPDEHDVDDEVPF